MSTKTSDDSVFNWKRILRNDPKDDSTDKNIS